MSALKQVKNFEKTLKEQTERALEERRKNYNASVKMILDLSPFDENMKRVFTELCHVPVEQTLYDAIILGVRLEEVHREETFNSIVEKGIKLYYLHTKFNQKLDRGGHVKSDGKDDVLLHCIVSEMKRRKKDTIESVLASYSGQDDAILGEDKLKEIIYEEYRKITPKSYETELYIEDPAKEHTDFDLYFKYLMSKNEDNFTRHQFNYIWQAAVNVRRSYTFFQRRPTKEELYLFCFGAAFDYDAFWNMKRLLMLEIENGDYKDAPAKGEAAKKRAMKRMKGYTEEDKRDKLLRSFLTDINSRLDCARREAKGIDNIPRKMIENVNKNLRENRERPLRYLQPEVQK